MRTHIISIILLFCTVFKQLDCATFENVKGVLTENIENSGCIDLSETQKPRTKPFTIQSDDSLLSYVLDEDDLTVIKIVNQNIPKLPENSIKDLTKITDLILKSSGLKEIESGAFKNVPKLRTVDLSDNELETIGNHVFCHLDIEVLTLDNNKIENIGDHAFTNMKLSHFYIQNNKLTHWIGDWFKGSPIVSVFAGKNLIEELHPNSVKFNGPNDHNVYIAYFNENKIKTVHPGAFNEVKKVETINLENNQIEDLGKNVFDGIEYISTLRLTNNKIKRIDKDTCKNTKIGAFILEKNQLSDFPLEPLKKNQVTYVQLAGNPIKCSFIEQIEEWRSNKNEYQRTEYEFPLGPAFKELKENCVQ